MGLITFRVALVPRAWARSRQANIKGRVMFFPAKEQEEYQVNFLQLAAPHAPPVPFVGPIALKLAFDLPFLASWAAWQRAAAEAQRVDHGKKPDLDNLIKNVLDSLTRSGAWWHDDAQVARLVASKGYALVPGTTVTIEQLEQPQRPARRTTPSAGQAALFDSRKP